MEGVKRWPKSNSRNHVIIIPSPGNQVDFSAILLQPVLKRLSVAYWIAAECTKGRGGGKGGIRPHTANPNANRAMREGERVIRCVFRFLFLLQIRVRGLAGAGRTPRNR
eukprot:2764646-Rhodomonas_salina.1